MGCLYHSTRGQAPVLDFRGVTMAGLASDGGLYIPQEWPVFSKADLEAMKGLSYVETAVRVMLPFVEPSLDEPTLRGLLEKTYVSFAVPEVLPLRKMGESAWLLELFHGPTFAFKDVALQFIGHLFEHFLSLSGEKMTVIGATSGDTGSAAIAALAGRKNIETVILYPHERPSEIQRKQMTCVDAANVHVGAVEGSFDDCQSIVKALFNDQDFRKKYNLAAVNSINWARILAQIVYYVFTALQLGAPETEVNFVVPTGNFGNVFAAYAARRCGLPVGRLVVASNSNNILTRFFATGRMEIGPVAETLSPSMDIQISSNFERVLWDVCEGDSADLRAKMASLTSVGSFEVTAAQLDKLRSIFLAADADNEATMAMIREVYERTGEVLDPHTAVGAVAAAKVKDQLKGPIVTLATAHPAKFPETIQRVLNLTPQVPETVMQLLKKPERKTILSADIQQVKDFLSSRIRTT